MPRRQSPSASAQLPLAAWGRPPGPLRNPHTGRFENASQREQRAAEPLPNRGATPASSTALPARSGPLRNPYTGRFENADSRRFRERQTELAELAGMGGESDDNDPFDLGEEEY